MVSNKVKSSDFEPLKKLGEGASGKVYHVRHRATGKEYVVKKVPFEGMEDGDKFYIKQESQILTALSHPNITKFERVFVDRKHCFNIVMEYANGGTLTNVIQRVKENGSRIPEEQILNYFTQLCLALKHCHDRKLLHRDIKPDNVFLTDSGYIKLGDFGVSSILKSTKARASTAIGTPEYMSPEVLSSKPYNAKSDIWSLGVLLYKMAMLEQPFKADSIPDLREVVLNCKYPALNGPYTQGFKNILQMCL